jgi:hypothetical protein
MKCKYTIPDELSLRDNRCWNGYCEICGRYTTFCEELNKYICCSPKCCIKLKENGYGENKNL